MGSRIIWSDQASSDLFDILEYWNKRTGSKRYSVKLYNEVKSVLKLIKNFPLIGKRIETREERYFIKEHYLIIYLPNNDRISIMRIWDTRKNPEDLEI